MTPWPAFPSWRSPGVSLGGGVASPPPAGREDQTTACISLNPQRASGDTTDSVPRSPLRCLPAELVRGRSWVLRGGSNPRSPPGCGPWTARCSGRQPPAVMSLVVPEVDEWTEGQRQPGRLGEPPSRGTLGLPNRCTLPAHAAQRCCLPPPCSEQNPNLEREGRAPGTRDHTAQIPPVQGDSRPDFSTCQYAAPLKW